MISFNHLIRDARIPYFLRLQITVVKITITLKYQLIDGTYQVVHD